MENNTEQTEKVSKDYYSITELAELSGYSRQRLHQMIAEGKIHPTIKTPLVFLFSKLNVEKILKTYHKEP